MGIRNSRRNASGEREMKKLFQYKPSRIRKIISGTICVFKRKYRLEIKCLKLRKFEEELEALYRKTISSLQEEVHEAYNRKCNCEWNKGIYREQCKKEFGKQILESLGVK